MAKQESKRYALFIDPDRHPQLFAWIEGNPYYWADFVRGAAEAALSRGEAPAISHDAPAAAAPPMLTKVRPGSRPPRRVAAAPKRALPKSPGQISPPEATPPAQSAPASIDTRDTPAQKAQAPVVEHGPVSEQARSDAPHAPFADAAEKPPQSQNENTARMEPTPAPQADVSEEQDETARLRELAKRALLGNQF